MNSLTNSGSFESVADAIVDTDLSDVGVEGAKLYLLSKDEAEALSADIRMLSSGDWALRTPANFNSCVYSVAPNGTVYECPVDNGFCVRPTLKLDLSKVDFTSDTDTFEIKSNFVSDIAAKTDLTYDGSKQDLITTGTAPDASVGMLQYSVKTASLITQNDNGYILLLSEEDVSSFKAGDLIFPANTNGIALPNGVKLKYGNNTYSYSYDEGSEIQLDKQNGKISIYSPDGGADISLADNFKSFRVVSYDAVNKVLEVEASELTDVFSWSASVPQGINAGNYPVYYRIIKDSTTVVEPTLIGTAVIGKADLMVTDANKPTAKTLDYDGEEKELVNAPATAPTGGTVKYKWNREDGTLYTNPNPPYVNLNDLKIGDIIHPINENGICLMQVESLVVKNASASNTYNHIVGNDYPYLYYYQSTDKLKLKISTDELYPQVVEWDYSEFDSFKVTAVNKTNSTLTVELHKYAPETSLNNWTADITKFTGTDAGEYKVEYKIEGDSNHKDSAVGSVDVTIGKGINGFAVPPMMKAG
ncbi:MAG: hypothetical protein K5979_06540 [Ruminococcus sp.]|nr:hypothetical protein [Ruminococcus sp.]